MNAQLLYTLEAYLDLIRTVADKAFSGNEHQSGSEIHKKFLEAEAELEVLKEILK